MTAPPDGYLQQLLCEAVSDDMVVRACRAVYGESWNFGEAEFVRAVLEAGAAPDLAELQAYTLELEKLLSDADARRAYKRLPEALRVRNFIPDARDRAPTPRR